MVGELITLPLRVGVRATQLWLRAAEEAVAVVADATGRLIDRAVPREHPVAAERRAAPDARAEPARAPIPEPAGAEAGLAAATPAATAFERPEPDHVSEEPELVEQIAEPGAEDGAGAAVQVREPWKGYERMNAEDVIDRLAVATPAELAAIQLYESERNGRETVLEAVERELRISGGSGSQR